MYRELKSAIDDIPPSLDAMSQQELYAAALAAHLKGNTDLEQMYLDQADAIDKSTSALKNYIAMAKIAANVSFTWGGGNADIGSRQFGGGGGGGGNVVVDHRSVSQGGGTYRVGSDGSYTKISNAGSSGGQHGLNMVVPPGFPNDSYRLNVSSAEHVKVTPAGQADMSQSGGVMNVTGVFNIIANNPQDLGAELSKLGRRS